MRSRGRFNPGYRKVGFRSWNITMYPKPHVLRDSFRQHSCQLMDQPGGGNVVIRRIVGLCCRVDIDPDRNNFLGRRSPWPPWSDRHPANFEVCDLEVGSSAWLKLVNLIRRR